MNPCQSCGMPIESGPYCRHCVDDEGNLQAFEERFERMVQWTRREKPDLDAAAAERATLKYMAGMPAWRDHPDLKRRLSG
jgi:hypothetical protein